LVGYLLTIEYALEGNSISAINFAPTGVSLKVEEVVKIASAAWGDSIKIDNSNLKSIKSYESSQLSLDASISRQLFGHYGSWNQTESINKSIEWWKNVLLEGKTPSESVQNHLKEFLDDKLVEK
ncbi:MAG: hypothetical protein ORN50_00235, partial [Crocinitomicaceae bacterium]|nr:hypothetical protein [Crocinitomicaceae bacterium]